MSPTIEAPTTAAPMQITPEGALVRTVIAESQKAKDKPRETLTKIARLKQVGNYAFMALMLTTMLSQMITPLMAESEGQSSGDH